jgi:osmoprotectant transport system ATP-binding protein
VTTLRALAAEAVVKRYGTIVALDAVSLEVAEGACLALVGESGSGKTTLLRAFNRLIDPDDGRILVGGVDVRALDPVVLRRQIGYVPQDGGLLPHWSVLRNVQMVPWLLGDAHASARAEEALALVGLEPGVFATRWPHELSGGQRQRVAIARALAAGPRIVLLDEPFGALDAITRAELQEAFARVRRELGVTTLLVTHDMREAFALADAVAVVRRGAIEQVAAPGRLAQEPASPYVAHLLMHAGMPTGSAFS